MVEIMCGRVTGETKKEMSRGSKIVETSSKEELS